MQSYIAYYRVSTKKQGLGLEAQKAIVDAFVSANGGFVIAEYSEKESGKDRGTLYTNRKELVAALAACKANNAALIVAKVDRLTRDMEAAANLVKHYQIVFCDHPDMDYLQQGIFFGMAMQERALISKRTKDALHEKKEKRIKNGLAPDEPDENGKLATGAPNATWTAKQREASATTRRENAKNNPCNLRAWTLVRNIKGLSWSVLASMLNEGGFTTAKGGKWSAVQVQRLVKLYEQ